MNMLPIAVAYVRGSTEEQVNTLAAQESQIADYCRYKRIVLDRTFTDQGESAYSTMFFERPAAAEMLEYIRVTGVTQIIIAKLDRCFRNVRDCLAVVDELTRRGIQLHILNIQVDTGTPTGRFFLTIMASLAELENGIRAERQHAATEIMHRQSQRAGRIPYGYSAVPAARTSKTGRTAEDLVPHPTEYPVLTSMLQWRADGQGWSAIALALNASSIPPKSGKAWYASTVQSVITHELRRRQAKGLHLADALLGSAPQRDVAIIGPA